jgi:hypothetical protein
VQPTTFCSCRPLTSAPPPPPVCNAGGGKAETAAQEANSVRPTAFKALVGKGHPEFSSGRQQVCTGGGYPVCAGGGGGVTRGAGGGVS